MVKEVDKTDALYSDPALTRLYDHVHGASDGARFYLSAAGDAPLSILDAGCGTGELATALSLRGHLVVAIDPSPRMIALGAKRPRGAEVDWRISTLQEFRAKSPFDLCIMTGHAFQCLLRDDDITAAFRAVKAALKPDGRFIFETRNPAMKPWREWTPERSRVTVKTDKGEVIAAFHETLAVEKELVTFQTTYMVDRENKPLASKSTLRFAGLDQIAMLAEGEGLNILNVFGNWDGSPFKDDSPEIIITAGVAAS